MAKPRINPSHYSVDNLVGWVGLILVLVAYTLVSFGLIPAQSIKFQSLMCLGSIGLMIISYRRRVMQPFVLNLIFTLVALVSLIRIIFYL